jgi:hypothetical protein
MLSADQSENVVIRVASTLESEIEAAKPIEARAPVAAERLTSPPIVALRVTHPVSGTAYFTPAAWAEVCNAPDVDLEREGITVEPLVRLADVERLIEAARRRPC